MPNVRIYHRGTTFLANESRIDDDYRQGNVVPRYAGDSWFVTDAAVLFDAEGAIPVEALSVINPTSPTPTRQLVVDATARDTQRQGIRDRTKGAGGRLDQLYGLLAARTISEAERDEMLALERGL